MNHFFLELLLHPKLSLHQEGLADLHEGVPHPDLGHDQNMAANHVKGEVQQNANENCKEVPKSINFDNDVSFNLKE